MNRSFIYFVAFLLLISVGASAQEKKAVVADGMYFAPQPEPTHYGVSHVTYLKDHLYYHLGDELNVVDVDVEWPDKIDGSLVRPLQRWLAEKLFKVDADNLSDAYAKMKARYGEPVREKFTTLPDDRKYCNVACELKEMGYEPSKYISYILTYLSEPKSLSSQKSDTTVMLITYDLQQQRVLTFDDIIRRSRIDSYSYRHSFIRMIIDGVGQEVEGGFDALQILDCCLSGDDILFKTLWTGKEDTVSVVSAVPWRFLKDYLQKDMYKQLRKPAAAIADEPLAQMQEKDGKPIYVAVEENAQFVGGNEAMMRHMKENLVLPLPDQRRNSKSRCVATFIVNEDGSVSDVAIISKVDSEIDRAVVNAIKSMPRWNPARQNGEAVKQRLSIPVQLVTQK